MKLLKHLIFKTTIKRSKLESQGIVLHNIVGYNCGTLVVVCRFFICTDVKTTFMFLNSVTGSRYQSYFPGKRVLQKTKFRHIWISYYSPDKYFEIHFRLEQHILMVAELLYEKLLSEFIYIFFPFQIVLVGHT